MLRMDKLDIRALKQAYKGPGKITKSKSKQEKA